MSSFGKKYNTSFLHIILFVIVICTWNLESAQVQSSNVTNSTANIEQIPDIKLFR